MILDYSALPELQGLSSCARGLWLTGQLQVPGIALRDSPQGRDGNATFVEKVYSWICPLLNVLALAIFILCMNTTQSLLLGASMKPLSWACKLDVYFFATRNIAARQFLRLKLLLPVAGLQILSDSRDRPKKRGSG